MAFIGHLKAATLVSKAMITLNGRVSHGGLDFRQSFTLPNWEAHTAYSEATTKLILVFQASSLWVITLLPMPASLGLQRRRGMALLLAITGAAAFPRVPA